MAKKKNYKDFFLPDFVEICAMSQERLHAHLKSILVEKYGYDIYDGKKYLLGVGSDVLLTAHMDTVHTDRVKTVVEKKDKKGRHILSSPQGIGGDDRCGIYIILRLLEDGLRPTVLFTEDEEIGGLGAIDFIKDSQMSPILDNALRSTRFMIEVDRANSNDAVFYDCDNPEFTDFILKTTGFKEEWGSFSDISELAPYFGVSAVNLSCGYYNAHKLDEYVVQEEMLETCEVIKKLLKEKTKQFEYIEAHYSWYSGYSGMYSGYRASSRNVQEYVALLVTFWEDGIMKYDCHEGYSYEDAMMEFFVMHPKVPYGDIIEVENDYF